MFVALEASLIFNGNSHTKWISITLMAYVVRFPCLLLRLLRELTGVLLLGLLVMMTIELTSGCLGPPSLWVVGLDTSVCPHGSILLQPFLLLFISLALCEGILESLYIRVQKFLLGLLLLLDMIALLSYLFHDWVNLSRGLRLSEVTWHAWLTFFQENAARGACVANAQSAFLASLMLYLKLRLVQ